MPPPTKLPTIAEIQALSEEKLGAKACIWQAEVCQALLGGQPIVLSTAATGAGKTMTFWLPMLYEESGISVIVVPLKDLGDQLASQASSLGMTSVSIKRETLQEDNDVVKVSDVLWMSFSSYLHAFEQRIEQGTYRVITMGPELLLDPRFHNLFSRPALSNRVKRIIIDEAHCVHEWGGSFRSEYLKLYRLYLRFASRVPCLQWYLTSATLTYNMAAEVLSKLHMPTLSFKRDDDHTLWLRRSNDRPNHHYVVRRMNHSIDSCNDLNGLVPDGLSSDDEKKITPFLVYVNSRKMTRKVAEHLKDRLHWENRKMIVWVHAGMSDHHRRESVEKFARGEIIGIIATDALGLVRSSCNLALAFKIGLELTQVHIH